MLDPARIAAAIECISQQDGVLGSILASHADRYAYSKIFDAIVIGPSTALCNFPPIDSFRTSEV
jgi:hypothetical protein